ncbi:xylulokinase [Clostridium sediminicola]|uniref:FGGY family carbohydrate kinase n=1 Tax=Clostridium sediminicola TaxID=3114879 RepID=UPI0031F1C6B9
MALIGIDIGTTGCKCTIFNHEGIIQSYEYWEYSDISPEDGWFELNPNEIWDSVKYVIKNAISKYSGEKVLGLSVSSLGEAAVLVDRYGKVLYNSLIYTDKRGKEQVERLEEKLGKEKIVEKTGLSPHAMYTISKLMWFKDNKPDIYNKTWKALLFGDFILYKLGNKAVIDYSLASRTMAFNVKELKWDKEILKAAEIKENIFADTVAAGTIIGDINEEIAEELGLPKDLKLVSGAHDQVCATIGAGVTKVGTAMDGIGTVECITPIFDNNIDVNDISKNNFPCVPFVNNKYTTYAFNFTGGSLLKWYRDTLGYEEIIEGEKLGKSPYEIFNERAAKKPTDILVLPHFAGSGTPYMNPDSKGAFIGLDFNVTKGHIFRSLLEGVTYEMKYNIECLKEAGIEIEEFRACGGGARSDLWLQIKADIMNKKVVALDVDEAGTLGTIILVGVALGIYTSLEEAIEKLVRVKKEFYPNEENVRIYEKNYLRYKKIYEAVYNVMN